MGILNKDMELHYPYLLIVLSYYQVFHNEKQHGLMEVENQSNNVYKSYINLFLLVSYIFPFLCFKSKFKEMFGNIFNIFYCNIPCCAFNSNSIKVKE